MFLRHSSKIFLRILQRRFETDKLPAEKGQQISKALLSFCQKEMELNIGVARVGQGGPAAPSPKSKKRSENK